MGVFKLFDRSSAARGKHIPVKVDVSGAAGPHGGLDGAPCGSWRKKEEYCSHSGQALEQSRTKKKKQVIDDLHLGNPWKMDHVKCCWLEFPVPPGFMSRIHTKFLRAAAADPT